jgi:hypothetical protein
VGVAFVPDGRAVGASEKSQLLIRIMGFTEESWVSRQRGRAALTLESPGVEGRHILRLGRREEGFLVREVYYDVPEKFRRKDTRIRGTLTLTLVSDPREVTLDVAEGEQQKVGPLTVGIEQVKRDGKNLEIGYRAAGPGLHGADAPAPRPTLFGRLLEMKRVAEAEKGGVQIAAGGGSKTKKRWEVLEVDLRDARGRDTGGFGYTSTATIDRGSNTGTFQQQLVDEEIGNDELRLHLRLGQTAEENVELDFTGVFSEKQ